MTNQLSTVQRVRAKYPTPLGAQHPAFLVDVAIATGAKLLRKDAGSHVTLANGTNVSQDILMFGDQGVDILSDAEGAAIASWQEKGQILGEYIDVSTIGPPPPPLPPVPPVPVVDLSDILRRLAALEGPRQVALRTGNGHYVCAEENGGTDVNATRTSAGPWETFTLEPK